MWRNGWTTVHSIQCGSEEEKTDWLAQLGSAIDSLWETDHISRVRCSAFIVVSYSLLVQDRRGRVTGIISSQGPDTDDAIPSPDQKKRRGIASTFLLLYQVAQTMHL